jgi:hypothetical protein
VELDVEVNAGGVVMYQRLKAMGASARQIDEMLNGARPIDLELHAAANDGDVTQVRFVSTRPSTTSSPAPHTS